MNVLSLFDGISCGRLALERAGISVTNYYASEINDTAISITQRHYPNTIQLGDVTQIDVEVLQSLPRIDLLIGGSPCQGFSRNGKTLNFNDPRSALFFEYVRILNWLKTHNNPNLKFLLENVEMKKEWEAIITQYLGVEPVLINSKVLSCQNRPRLYWANFNHPAIPVKEYPLSDILEEVTGDWIEEHGIKFDATISEKSRQLVINKGTHLQIKQATKKGYIEAHEGDGVNLSFPTSKTRRGRVIKGKSNTLDCSCAGWVYHKGIIRPYTINELEQLQTLPIGYTEGISLKDRKHAIGNGWTVNVIAHLFNGLRGEGFETL